MVISREISYPQQMEKTDGRRLSMEALNERRRRAVRLRMKGMTLVQIAETVELSRTTVTNAVKAYEEGGWKAVPVGRRGRSVGDGRRLSEEQELEIQRVICERTQIN